MFEDKEQGLSGTEGQAQIPLSAAFLHSFCYFSQLHPLKAHLKEQDTGQIFLGFASQGSFALTPEPVSGPAFQS